MREAIVITNGMVSFFTSATTLWTVKSCWRRYKDESNVDDLQACEERGRLTATKYVILARFAKNAANFSLVRYVLKMFVDNVANR